MWTPGLVALIGFADLRDTAHGHLCGQPVAISQSLVEELLQRHLVRCFPGKRFTRQPVSRRVEGTHRLLEFRDLI